MKKHVKIFIAFLFITLSISIAHAQLVPLTFDLKVSNLTYADTINGTDPLVSGNRNVIEFDIYILQTNVPANDAEKMRFALGQYYLHINFGGLNNIDTIGGYASLTYISGSTTFTNLNARPTNLKLVAIASAADQSSYWPDFATGVRGGYISMSSNPALGNTSDVQISTINPGTRVGRYRLKKKIGFFPNVFFHLRWRNDIPVTIPNPNTKIFAYNGLGGASTEVTNKATWIMDTTNLFTSTKIKLNLKVLMEGLYYPLFNLMSRKDNIKVTLRNASSPYAIVDSANGNIDSITFSNVFTFNNAPTGMYYIVVKHFSSIDVWSKSGGDSLVANNSLYNFDFTSSDSQAYGSNLKLKGTKYCLYSGNVNQDRIIDAADLSAIENDATEGVTGYSVTDLNGDKIVDVADLSIVDNNIGVAVVQP